jgi:hypothetical protein
LSFKHWGVFLPEQVSNVSDNVSAVMRVTRETRELSAPHQQLAHADMLATTAMIMVEITK